MTYIITNFRYNVLRMWFAAPLWYAMPVLLYFKLITNAPNGAESPGIVVFDFLPQPLDMDIDSTCISNVFIAPDMV